MTAQLLHLVVQFVDPLKPKPWTPAEAKSGRADRMLGATELQKNWGSWAVSFSVLFQRFYFSLFFTRTVPIL
jgi:hypothetical protein